MGKKSALYQNYFDIELTDTQKTAFDKIRFFVQSDDEKVFILRGYAGTGKSTIIKGIIRWLQDKEVQFELLASTGRAAKVVSDKTGHQTSTVHGAIYKFDKLSEDLDNLSKEEVDKKGQISLNFSLRSVINPDELTIYIIDEASMISDSSDSSGSFAKFGTGRLLNDLFAFNQKAKFIFIGDASQLPPVGSKMDISPALNKPYIENTFGYKVEDFALTEIKRQDLNSGIIKSSMILRNMHERRTIVPWPPKLQVKGHGNDISFKSNHVQLINEYIERIANDGFYDQTLICGSNAIRHQINLQVRRELFPGVHELKEGDLLMITQNNMPTGLVNGDQVKVLEVLNREERAGLTFLKVRIQELVSFDIYITYLIEDVLQSANLNISENQHKRLLIDFHSRMEEKNIKQKDTRFKDFMREDRFLNGLRAVYGYAITCHKSQGGEWDHVYLYLDNKILGKQQPEIYQWWYTAITRAKKNLHLVDDWFIY